MQIDAPEGYTAKMLKRDMLTYLNMNADYFTVNWSDFQYYLLCYEIM